MCEKVLDDGTRYMIEKALRYNKKFNITETLFEYAICAACHEKIAVKLSQESLQRLGNYFAETMDHSNRTALLFTTSTDLNEWIGKCAVKGTNVKDCTEYQMCCECEGEQMMMSHLPMMLSEEAMLEMNELLSAETKDELDRFRDDFLGIPPELKELLKDKTPVFV